MTLFQAFILGLVQGVAEFLPISSSAHLILVPWFLKWQDPGLAFDVFLHLGTLVAVLLYFIRDWFALLRAGIASIIERRIGFDRDRLLFWLLIFGTIPGGLAGLLFNEQAETGFRAPLLIAINLAVVGFLIYWIDGKTPSLRSMEDLTVKDAVWIGIAKAFAIVPGVSRSGSTMAMARFLSLNRESSARFSFLLSMPITAAAALFKFRDLTRQVGETIPWDYVMTGFLSTVFFGLISIYLLLLFLRHADFIIFAWYRILIATVIIGCSLFRGM